MAKAALPLPLPLSLSIPLLIAALAAVTAAALSLSALRHWWAERAGKAYELPVNRTGTVLRATAAALAGVTALAAAYAGLGGGARPAHITAAPAPVRAPASTPARAPAPPRLALPTPPRTLAHPAGGTLQRLADGTRVWLPPQYRYASAADLDFPAVIAYAANPEVNDLLTAFEAYADRGLADPFVLVLPTPDRCGKGIAGKPWGRLLAGYRIAPARSARGLLGLGGEAAPCAVREALAHPARYEAAAAVSGTYDSPHDAPPVPPRNPRTTRPRPPLLLATPSGAEAAAASALRLRDTLKATGPGEVRILDGITPSRLLLALIAGYFTEKLDGPAHPNHP